MVIKQGDEGDYFYVIVSGKCVVTRETPLNKEGIKLAELGVGDTFGEEALIAEAKRNATVTMLTDGVLMRLNKEDFRELMNEPLLQWVNYDEAREIVGARRQVARRAPAERASELCIEDSLNIPLYFIRLKLSALDPKVPYVVYCDTGRRSSAAAYILVERGFDAYVLRGGLASGNVRCAARRKHSAKTALPTLMLRAGLSCAKKRAAKAARILIEKTCRTSCAAGELLPVTGSWASAGCQPPAAAVRARSRCRSPCHCRARGCNPGTSCRRRCCP